jgi:hypothetical protein
MADEKYCGNDEVVYAGDRTSSKTAWWGSDWFASGGMCTFTYCNSVDIRAWFAATENYIENKFKPHFKKYKDQISMTQVVSTTEQQQLIVEANDLLASWNNYASYYRKGGGGPIGSSWGEPGFRWDGTFWADVDPAGPNQFEPMGEEAAFFLCKEIVRYYDDFACMQDKFDETRPEGMLQERPGIGVVPGTKTPEGGGGGGFGMNVQTLAISFGGYLLIKALMD